MRYKPDIHHRRSVRLREYDYRSAGAYFLTICAHKWECLFGKVVDGEIRLSSSGEIVLEEWLNTAVMRTNVELDAYVIMPNHFHAVIFIHNEAGEHGFDLKNGTVSSVGAHCMRPHCMRPAHIGRAHSGAPLRRQSGSIGSIVAGFKSTATKRINTLRDNPGCPVWQRNYYEHVIRNEKELANILKYIGENPLKWDLDENNPENKKLVP
jgi:REP element-mobilizing transposase RayT